MASILTSQVCEPVHVVRRSEAATADTFIAVHVGRGATLYLSREEAAKLAAELLNAAGVEPAEVAA